MSFDPSSPVLSAPSPQRESPLKGMLTMAAGFVFYSIADAISKLLTADFHPLQIAFTRQSGLMLGVLALLVLRGPALLRTGHPVRQMLRGTVAAVSSVSFIIAIGRVPLADAVAVSFVAPFIVTLLAGLVLKEPIGIRRWSAVAVGFVGTLIVVRPGLGVLDPAIFMVVIAASAFAVRQILSRSLGGIDGTATTLTYTALTAGCLVAIPLPWVWTAPTSGREVALMVTLALVAGCGEFCIVRALELARAVALAPMQYTLIVWGTVWGYLLFAQLPDMWTWIGAAIIAASGFYTLQREARMR